MIKGDNDRPRLFVLDTNGSRMTQVDGHIFFQTAPLDLDLPESLPSSNLDNHILGTAKALRDIHRDHTVIIVSKEINLRIKAAILGIPAEGYANDRCWTTSRCSTRGRKRCRRDSGPATTKAVESWQEAGHTFYKIIRSGPRPLVSEPVPLF